MANNALAASDLLATGIARDIRTTVGNAQITGSEVEAWGGQGTMTTNHWSQTTTTTVKDIAVNGARLVAKYAEQMGDTEIFFEYSPSTNLSKKSKRLTNGNFSSIILRVLSNSR